MMRLALELIPKIQPGGKQRSLEEKTRKTPMVIGNMIG
jgi:hypothetical protein